MRKKSWNDYKYFFYLHVKSCDFDRFWGAESEKKWVQKKLKRGFKRVKIG